MSIPLPPLLWLQTIPLFLELIPFKNMLYSYIYILTFIMSYTGTLNIDYKTSTTTTDTILDEITESNSLALLVVKNELLAVIAALQTQVDTLENRLNDLTTIP